MEKVETFEQQPPPPPQQHQNTQIKQDGEKSINENTDVKRPFKRYKINKEERRKRLNAQMSRLVYPKSPLVVFSDLFEDVPIHIQEHRLNNVTSYTAIFIVDDQIYSANNISKALAKQNACENFLRTMLTKKLSERSEKKEESPMNFKMEVGESGSISKPEGPPQEDFPWPNFASLAMHYLINKWELQSVFTRGNHVQKKSTVIKPQPKVNNH
ncbi:uncharacterized protein LOC126552786 [Aphis gossypii]|uniref:uncharacterized protein LOC126552786 n=1 Tax=Aphis gossypii TaxID=80765 RepID=UPI00215963B3|nr:uncharacterized protein LOC126552786 [Aphis gossypii]XP_050063678.1 uncharacterized protein LOC126552786 [Aphis gossypii]XP_050063679.1 uncharacterized protein LOC126552786 [Aphis gossypii]XP_050063680.1 uncharacterized protein LOC126552786 [Aphis gossypii]